MFHARGIILYGKTHVDGFLIKLKQAVLRLGVLMVSKAF